MLRRALDAYYRALAGTMTALIFALTLVVSYQIFSRYLEFVPRYIWTEEMARFCFVWVLLLGAAVAIRDGSHFTIDVLPQDMSPGLRRALEALALVLVGVVAVVMLFGGLRLVGLGTERISATSGIQLAWVFAAIPVSGLSMLVFVGERLARLARGESVEQPSRGAAEAGGVE